MWMRVVDRATELRCKECDGCGENLMSQYFIFTDDEKEDLEKCNACKGTGIFLEFRDEHNRDLFYQLLNVIRKMELDNSKHNTTVANIAGYMALVVAARVDHNPYENILFVSIENHGVIFKENVLQCVF